MKFSNLICFTFILLSVSVYATDSIPKPKHHIYVVAHRGAHNVIPENTLEAYRKAIALSCDFVEIDVRTTKDNKIVSVHNSTIDAYCIDGTKGPVKAMTLTELKQLDIGSRIDEKWQAVEIPTFDEILETCKGKTGIYLDLKDASIDVLLKTLKQYGMMKNVIWYVPYNVLKKVANVRDKFKGTFIMPDPGENNWNEVITYLKPQVIASDMNAITVDLINMAHTSHIKVFVDEKLGTEAEWKKMIAMGIDGIQTDSPEKLMRFLKRLYKEG